MKKSRLPWIVSLVAVLAIGGVFFGARSAGGTHHPQPRPGITGASVLAHSTFAGYDRIARAYQIARAVPGTLDGIYCHCHCKENFAHRSLLSCFESEHGASCDICMLEAERAYSLGRQGQSLDQIRLAIDREFVR